MKRDNINYLVVGLFVLGLFALLLVVVFQLTGRGGPRDHYTVTYDNVGGIKFGTPVLYEGYQVGQVEALEPQPTAYGMQYQVTLSVTKDWQIPADSVARVEASGLLSAMTIEIEEGDSKDLLVPGSEIAGRDAVSLFATVNDVAAEFKQLSDDSLRPLLDSLTVNINRLTDELMLLTREDIRPLIADMQQKLDGTEIVEQTNTLFAKLNRSADSLEMLLSEGNRRHVTMTLDNLRSASGNLNALLASIDRTRKNMDKVLVGIDELVSNNEDDLQATVSQLRTALEIIATNIDSVTYHLEGTSRNIHEFSRYLRANPGALLRSPAPVDAAAEETQQ